MKHCRLLSHRKCVVFSTLMRIHTSYFINNKVIDVLKGMSKNVSKTNLKTATMNERHKDVGSGRSPSEIYLHVIGNGAKSSSRSVYLFTDQRRYLFNCGEGTQRLAHEYKVKLSKLEHIFFTNGTWENIGGLPGLILTLQSVGVPKITLHGPNNINNLFDLTKQFMAADDIVIDKRHVEEGFYEDNVMTVKYIPLHDSHVPRMGSDLKVEEPFNHHKLRGIPESPTHSITTSTEQSGNGTQSDNSSPVRKKPRLIHAPNMADSFCDSNICIAYICKFANKPGQLIIEKCLDLGVPPGPLLGDLKNGKDITLQNNRVVRSVDVLTAEEPGPVLIILECPTINYLNSLLECDAFRPHQTNTTLQDVASLIVHFTPKDVLCNELYQEFMHRFHHTTDHIIINESNCGPSSVAVHKIQHKLNMINGCLFPLLKEDMIIQNGLNENIETCETMLKYSLRPKQKAIRSPLLNLNLKDTYEECLSMPGFSEALSELKSKLGSITPPVDNTNKDNRFPEIIFLGTGSSVPSKVRNTSALLINISTDKSLLLDCGEGTFIQLCRLYGNEEVDAVLRKVHAVFISHLHADHHIGLIEVIKRRRLSFLNASYNYVPLEILTCHQVMSWLHHYHKTVEPLIHYISMTDNSSWCEERLANEDNYKVNFIKKMGLKQLIAVPVKHCRNAFGIAFTLEEGWKLVYSGDTMPCDTLVKAGQNCDLLIHEATMEDDLEGEAVMKRHSTTSQAINQGIKMNAKFTLLTHFSQRYAKVPLFTESFGSRVGVAFDFLRVSLQDLPLLPYFIPVLKAMFADKYEEMQEKTNKRLRRTKRGGSLPLEHMS